MKKHQTSGFVILGFILLLILFAATLIYKNEGALPKEINQTELIELAQSGKLTKVNIRDRELTAYGTDKTQYHVILPSNEIAADRIQQTLESSKVEISQLTPERSGQWLSILTSIILPIGLIVLLVVLFRSAQAGGSQAMSFGKSRAKLMPENKVKITFKDVAGIQESKEELEEVVDFLKNSERYQKLGARIPKGVLLVGAPGTGKTLLAKAVAGEAGVAFFSISGSDFVEMFVGVGASRVRDLFEQAKKHSPCIIFIDEIDAVGRQRGAGLGGGHDEREQTLNQLLVEMDGFDSTTGIIVIAATNRPDILDNALLRPGRFDRQVVIDRPDIKGRHQILNVHVKGKPIAKGVELKRLAKATPGFTGADLENMVNEAALAAARQRKEEIEMIDLEEAIDKVVVGPEKRSKVIKEKDKEITAYHEIGHALMQIMHPGQYRFRKVTIIPRGMALGISWAMPEDDNTHVSRDQLHNEIASLLGGRVAEELIFNQIWTGASSDIDKATEMARKIVTVFGMSSELGTIKYGQQNDHVFLGRDFGTDRDYSEAVAAKIDSEIKKIIDTQYELAKKTLGENRDMMDALVRELLERETLEDKEVYKIMDQILIGRGEEPKYSINQSEDDDSSDDDYDVDEISSSNGSKNGSDPDKTDTDKLEADKFEKSEKEADKEETASDKNPDSDSKSEKETAS